jgi:hypothetical protein
VGFFGLELGGQKAFAHVLIDGFVVNKKKKKKYI